MLLRAVTALVSACALAAGCASTLSSPAVNAAIVTDASNGAPRVVSRSAEEGVAYALPQAVYEVALDASRYDVVLRISGPKIVASDQLYRLDLEMAESSAGEVRFDVDPTTNLAQRVVVSSDSRVDQIAARLGQAIGSIGGGVTNLPGEPVNQGALTGQGADRARLFHGYWRVGGPSIDAELNTRIREWFARFCTVAQPCESTTAPTVSLALATASANAWVTQTESADCTRYLCFARSQSVDVVVGIGNVNASAAAPSADADRGGAANVAAFERAAPVVNQQYSFTAVVPNPNDVGQLDLRFDGPADGVAHVAFAEGSPTQFAYARTSPIESGLTAPINFVAGLLNTFVRIIPLRLVVDIQRTQAEAIRESGGTTIMQPSKDVLAEVVSQGSGVSLTDLLTALKTLGDGETRSPENSDIIVLRRVNAPPAAPVIVGGGNASGANGGNGTTTVTGKPGGAQTP